MVFAETVYNIYNLPNVENIAVGCSQVNFVQHGSGNIPYNFWYVFWFSSPRLIKLVIFNNKCVKSDVFHHLFLHEKHDLFLPSLNDPHIFKQKGLKEYLLQK